MLTTSPPVSELADRLRLTVTRTARRLRQQGDPALSPTLAAALSTIERFGPLGPSELARIERVQRPTITRVIARLCELGLVERLPDERDRRAALLEATPAGRRALRTLRRRKTAYLAERLERLEPEERELMARAADLLERLLEEEPT
ncbi:MAG: MarR family transcriptional regulator [Actinomycetota bacterium]|nr:MarR family transcriptional regulator [Actinomycetota bacterium]MDQ3720807.1 MarR family transcriptional regulator [Actinomycetota bacterium]